MKRIGFFGKTGFRKRPGGGVRFSITFKTTAAYTLMFGVVLAVAVAGLTSVLTTYTIRTQNLDRLAVFVSDHFSRPGGPELDLESFAEANRVYIELADAQSGAVYGYGTRNAGDEKNLQTARRINLPGRRLSLRVVDEEHAAPGPLSAGGFFVAAAALLALAAAFGSLMMRRMMQPVYAMTRTARSITASDLSARIDAVHSHDELKELAETFNGMLDRLQESYEQQNRFVSDASHELRTPLNVISGYANLLRRWGTEDRAVTDESVGKIIEETDNMKELVERLLFLARADKKTQQIHFERFDVSALMERIAEETRVIDGEHTLNVEIAEGVFLTADCALIKQAVRAMLENSIKFTPPGGAITLSCRAEKGEVLLGVRDTGAGISQKDLPHIFDRFYKADEARLRKGGGTGLGLSIVKWIVERHGGTIHVESEPGKGSSFTVRLPEMQENRP